MTATGTKPKNPCRRGKKGPYMMIEALYPAMRLIHVFLDNARYHHAKLVQDWMTRPGRRIRLHFIPSYCDPAIV